MQKIDAKDIVRHAIDFLFLGLAWHYLSQWYEYQQYFDYVIFSGLLLAALFLGFGKSVASLLRKNSRPLFLIVLLLLIFLSFPWEEFFHFHENSLRWSEKLLFNVISLYAVAVLWRWFPKVFNSVHQSAVRLIASASATSYGLLVPSILFFVISLWIVFFVLKKTFIAQDPAAHYFQARIFEHFKFFAPVPAVPDFFSWQSDLLVMYRDRWFGMFFPGYALLLAATIPLRGEWIVSPLLGAITVGIWVAYAKRWHNRQLALLVGLLCALSPFLLLMSSTMQINTPELFLCSATIYLLRRQLESQNFSIDILLCSLMLFGMLVRPFSIFIFLTPVLLYYFWRQIQGKHFTRLAMPILGIVLGSLLLLYFNVQTTDNMLVTPYTLELPTPLGFSPGVRGMHTPLRGLANTSVHVLGMNEWLTGWHSGALFFLLGFLLLERRLEVWDRILLLSCAALAVFFYFFLLQEVHLGPRYYYPMAPVLLLMIAKGCRIDQSQVPPERKFLTSLLIIFFLAFLPARFMSFINMCNFDGSIQEILREKMHQNTSKKLLIFIDPYLPQDYINWNDPFLQDPITLCRDLGPRNSEAISAFPDRQVLYFRASSSRRGMTQQNSVGFFPDPAPQQEDGFLSMYDLAAMFDFVRNSKERERDFVDFTYIYLFRSGTAAATDAYVNTLEERADKKSGHKKEFQLALVHTAKMVLIPLLLFEQHGDSLLQHFHPSDFRNELDTAILRFQGAGDVGIAALYQLNRIKRRIDRNSDGACSDAEIIKYIANKRPILMAMKLGT